MFDPKTKNLFKIKLKLSLVGKLSLLELKKKSQQCLKSQEVVLRDILTISKDTEYGKKYRFEKILSAEDSSSFFNLFEQYVPVNQYEQLYPYIERHKNGEENILFPGKPKMYATTSGSTNVPKWIPITDKYYYDVYNRMSPIWLYSFLAQNSHAFDGTIISNVGKTVEGAAPDGTVYGSIAGVSQRDCPPFIKAMFASPSEIFMIEDFKARYYTIMRMGIEGDAHVMIGGNPSTFIEMQNNVDEFLDDYIEDIEQGTLSESFYIPDYIRLAVKPYLKPNPKRAQALKEMKKKYSRLFPKHYWPNLKILNVWKSGNSAVYLKKIKDYFPESCYFLEQGYFVPECRPGLVIQPDTDSTVLFPHKNYFEFVREKDLDQKSPRFFHLDELKVGDRYCIYVTTYSGLYRYNLNDLIEVTGFYEQTPMIRFVQKINGFISMSGEKLNENQFIEAVKQVQKEFSKKLIFFIGFASIQESKYHIYYEFQDQDIQDDFIERFTSRVDSVLKSKNMEYADKRESGRVEAPVGHLLQMHSFEIFKSRIIDQGLYHGRFQLNYLIQDEMRHGMFKKLIKRRFG